jgi:plastocyanin
MKTEFRNRVFLPVVMPLAIVLALAAFVGALALTFLHGNHAGSLALAAAGAGGILFTVTLATTQDRLDAGRKAVLVLAAATPFVIGGLIGVGVLGDLEDEDRLINIEPLAQVPEDAVIAAENSQEFCLPTEDGCEPTELWTVETQGEDQFVFEFDNIEDGVPHNVSIAELAGDRDAPEEGDERLHNGDVITGPDEIVETVEPGLEPGDYFFVCDVHPTTMIGVLEVVEEGEGEADDA